MRTPGTVRCAVGPARARRGRTGRNGRSGARPSQTALLPVSSRLHRSTSGARKVGESSTKRNGAVQPTGISPTGQIWALGHPLQAARPPGIVVLLLSAGAGYGAHASPVTQYYQLPCAPRDPPIQPTSGHTLSRAAQLWCSSAQGHSRQFCPNPSLRSDERVAI